MQSGNRRSKFRKLRTYSGWDPFLGLSNGTGPGTVPLNWTQKTKKSTGRDLNGNMQSGERKRRPPLIWYLTRRGMEARASSNISRLPGERGRLIDGSRQCCKSGSVGSICFWASRIRIQIHLSEIQVRILLSSSRNSKKNIDSYYFVTSLWLVIFCRIRIQIRIH